MDLGSPQWLQYTVQTQEETHGRGWLKAVHPDDRGTMMAAWYAASEHGQIDVEFRLKRASDGKFIYHRTLSKPLSHTSPSVLRAIAASSLSRRW